MARRKKVRHAVPRYVAPDGTTSSTVPPLPDTPAPSKPVAYVAPDGTTSSTVPPLTMTDVETVQRVLGGEPTPARALDLSDLPMYPSLEPPTPPIPPAELVEAAKEAQALLDDWDEEKAMAALKSNGVEQSWIPAAILQNGTLLVNLPRGPFVQLTARQIYDLLVARDERKVEILQADAVCEILGVKQ